MDLGNVARVEELFQGMGIQVVTGHRYPGGFIGDREAEVRWLGEKITGWAESVETLAGVSRNHPQSAYAGLHKSLHQEWAFVQWVTLGIGDDFGLVEKALRETFVLDFLRDWVTAYQIEGLPACQPNRRYWPLLTQPRRPLRTGRRPVSSQETSLQHSLARWSYGQQSTRPASGRVGQRLGEEANGGRRTHWR